jgi:hypothetical protein
VRGVLFSGTADEAAEVQAHASPAHTWPEARNPANQWLADLKGAKAHRVRVHNAGVEARKFIRAGYAKAGIPLPPYEPHKPFQG